MTNRILRVIVLCLLFSFAATARVQLIQEDKKAGLELYETALGRLWIPAPGSAVIKNLEWEQVDQQIYNHPSAHVSRGDIVIDCGAHIGGFTRVALAAGARLVVSIEPEKLNTTAFRRNFAEELKKGSVILVEKGVWDKTGILPLHLSKTGDSHSVAIPQNSGKDETIELTTIDVLAGTLKLPRIDFIKMDIEGAELNALRGARQALQRWQPRLAISSYHKRGDPSAICGIVWEAQPKYLIGSKDRWRWSPGSEVPKVLFFY
jgi:FkbM family methyltransferase